MTPETVCHHCSSPIPDASRDAEYCCDGCRAVATLLREQGLGRYYELAGGVVPAAKDGAGQGGAWLEPLLTEAESRGPVCGLELDVQGVHCTACVWLMNELFQRRDGGVQCVVNPSLGKLRLSWRRGVFDLRDYLSTVERFGYRFGPSRKTSGGRSNDLPLRIGVSAALTMNTMMLSAAFYAGLAPSDGDLFQIFSRVSFWLTTGVFAIGGWPFFRSAWEGLRRRVLHLDLPIALSIVLVYATSIVQTRTGRGDLAYYDTLDTFITLMLVGRLLQERMVERNRAYLLDDAGADAIVVRRLEAGRPVVVKALELSEGDELLVTPGELVPVDGELIDGAGRCSLDWITGESASREVGTGETIPAGAFNAGATSLRLRAKTAFEASPLPALLRATHQGAEGRAVILTVATRYYVPVVLLLGALGYGLWRHTDPSRALDVTVALLVVTCPCAIGIAVPLAYELAFASLRRRGVFVRAGDLLDRLRDVRKVLFDKTGTVTLAALELADPEVVHALSDEARDAAFDLTARSSHPVSRCLSEALGRHGARFNAEAIVREVPGAGLELDRHEHRWRLGRAAFALGKDDGSRETLLSRDGVRVAAFALKERLRPGSKRGIAALERAGLDVWLISGDTGARVDEVAEVLGVRPERVLSQQRPEDKAAAVERLDQRDTLFIGDGVNDALAFSKALCAGSPAVDRPVMPGKSDFFLLGDHLDGLGALFETSERLRRAVRRNLTVALAYNALAVGACLAGWMSPLRAAIAMPLSSLTVLLLTMWSLRRTAPVRSLSLVEAA